MSQPEPGIDSFVRIIDPLASVRGHPEWFFRSGSFTTGEALARLVAEALAHGSTDVAVRQIDGWWLLTSRRDWLNGDLQSFYSLTPDPQHGPNTTRIEIALTAFCPTVVTASHGVLYDVVSSAAVPVLVNVALAVETQARVVAFLPPPITGTDDKADDTPKSRRDRSARSSRLVAEPTLDLMSALESKLDGLPDKLAELTGQGHA